jgi:hypothetical protein
MHRPLSPIWIRMASEVIWGSYDAVALNGENGTEQWRVSNGSRVWPGVAWLI